MYLKGSFLRHVTREPLVKIMCCQNRLSWRMADFGGHNIITSHPSIATSITQTMSLNGSPLPSSASNFIFSILVISSWVNSSLCFLTIQTNLSRQAMELGASNEHDMDKRSKSVADSRRSFFNSGLMSLSTTIIGGSSIFGCKAAARGLVRFPCKEPLLNTYILMRAGTSLLEAEDILSTNPLFLTNREAALSEKGEDEVRRACNLMKMSGITPTVVRYSLAASSIDSANIVGEELKIGRDRLVPEFNYMDPRAIGGKLPSSYMRRVLLHR